MTNLPVKVLQLIFDLLGQRDQLTCMTVCKQWHSVLLDHSFFRVLSLTSMEQINKLNERVKNHPNLRQRAERVILSVEPEQDLNLSSFAQSFPNVRVFEMFHVNGNLFNRNQRHPWCESIEQIIEHGWDMITKTLLSSGLCKNLVHIAVDGEKSVRDVIVGLANAPALRKLQLNHYEVTLDDLELLHTTVPLLTSLEMDEIEYTVYTNTIFPEKVKPATSMRNFKCHLVDTYDTNKFSRYVSQKYTRLQKLDIDYTKYDFGRSDDVEQKQLLASWCKTLAKRLKTLSIDFRTVEDEIPMDGYYMEDSDDEFGDSYSRDYDLYFDFSMLDKIGCRLRNLTMDVEVYHSVLNNLWLAKQEKYIQSLKVSQYVFCDQKKFSFFWLHRFSALKELSINFDLSEKPDQTPRIAELMTYLDRTQVKTLELSGMRMDFDASSTRPCLTVKNLTLTNVDFDEGADVTLSQTFPNLKCLKIEESVKKMQTLVLPQSNLSYLEISNVSAKTPIQALVLTLDDNQQRLYTARKASCCDSSTLGTNFFPCSLTPSQPYCPSTEIPYLTIICQSLSHFLLTKADS